MFRLQEQGEISISILKDGFLDNVEIPTHRSMKNYKLTKETVQVWKGLFKGKKVDDYIVSQEEAIETVFNLFLYTEYQSSKSNSYYILDKLGRFNTLFDFETGEIRFDTYRDQKIIEDILNELYDSKDKTGLFKFCTKDYSGRPYLKDYSLKQWMSDLYTKITLYTGANPLIQSAQKKLLGIKETHCKLDTNLDKNIFNDLEVEAGKAMFDVFNHLFGHFTVRLILMGMFNWYLKPKMGAEPERIKILIDTRSDWETTRKSIRRYCLVPSSKYIPYISLPFTDTQIRTKDIYSLLFEDSRLFLPTGKRNELTENAVFFGYSPVEIIDGRNTIYSLYKKFRSQTPDIELYTRSCEAMLEVVENAIKEKVESDPSIDPSDRDTKIKEYTELARAQIFLPNNIAYVRFAIEKFMKTRNYLSVQGLGDNSHRIEIMIPMGKFKESVPYEIFLNKDDFTGLNIQVWGDVINSFLEGEIWECMAKKHPDDPFWTK